MLGTRPEAIKLAPVIQAARAERALNISICITGQHRKLLSQVLEFFEIQPDYDLRVMRNGQDLTTTTARILNGVRSVFLDVKPDLAIVQGDTTSCFAGALAAFYEGVPVAHVEAGLRTRDLSAPFPEEAMRQMTSRLAALHFAPTERNRLALLEEQVPAHRVFVTGNTVIDALLWTRDKVRASAVSPLAASLSSEQLTRIRDTARIVLVTGHRRETLGAGFRSICAALSELARRYPALLIVYPLHPNPEVCGPAREYLAGNSNILLTDPVEYPAFVDLMDRSYMIITDSGGIQEEAPSLHKPVLVTRAVTERQEAVDSGHVRLVGTKKGSIIAAASELLESSGAAKDVVPRDNPYGDGRAASRIVALLQRAT